MASSSTNPTAGTNFSHNITEKLTKSNHVLWKAQVMSSIRGAQMEPFLDADTTRKRLIAAVITAGESGSK
jgi:hypothetical protein